MSTPIQNRSITIIWNGKPITWRPQDQIPQPAEPAPALVQELRLENSNEQEKDPRKKSKLGAKLKRRLRLLLPSMKRDKGPTKVLVTGTNTWSTKKHSFLKALKFWNRAHRQHPEPPRDVCESKKTRLGSAPGDVPSNKDELSTNPLCANPVNPLWGPTIDQEEATYERALEIMSRSDASIPRSAPIPVPGTATSSCRCSEQQGVQSQQDGNVKLDVKDTSLIKTSSISDSIVDIVIEHSPALSPRPFSTTSDSLPEDGQLPSPTSECFTISEEDFLDPKLPPALLGLAGLSLDNLRFRDDTISLSSESLRAWNPHLEAELKEAMESPISDSYSGSPIASSVTCPELEIAQRNRNSSDTSLAESFSRTRSTSPSLDGHSAPSHSFLIERPHPKLSSDFVDIEDYIIELSGRSSPPYPALDSSATSEEFGFKPTCQHMPGSWPEERTSQGRTSQELIRYEAPAFRRLGTMPTNEVLLFTPDLESSQGFSANKGEIFRCLQQVLPPHLDDSLIFSRCRPILDTSQDDPPSPCASPALSDSDYTTSVHLRGGGEEGRFSIFRPVGKGKLVGNAERGRKLLDEPVSGNYLVGGWGRGQTWRGFCDHMEKRCDKKKEVYKLDADIDKLKAEKKKLNNPEKLGEDGGNEGKGLMAKVKGMFGGGKEGGE